MVSGSAASFDVSALELVSSVLLPIVMVTDLEVLGRCWYSSDSNRQGCDTEQCAGLHGRLALYSQRT